MAFNCDFNAPMFVDFTNMDEEANPDEFFDMQNEQFAALHQIDEPKDAVENKTEPSTSQEQPPPLPPKKKTTVSAAFLEKISRPPANSANKKPFVSMAEKALNFHQQVPDRLKKSTLPYKHRSSSADRIHQLRGKSTAIFATEPMSPNLRTRSRSRERKIREAIVVPKTLNSQSNKMDVKSTLKNVEAHYGIPSIKKKLRSVKKSEDVPQKHVVAKTINDAENRVHAFKAKPMPNFNAGGLKKEPLRTLKSPLKAKPFHFQTMNRARCKMSQDPLKNAEMASLFKAKSADVLYKKPFVAQPSSRSPVKTLDIELHTETRQQERKPFEEYIKHRAASLQASKAQEEERRRKEEEKHIQEMRKGAVHKAQPVRRYAGVTIKQSDKPVTQPITPNFSKRRRHVSE